MLLSDNQSEQGSDEEKLHTDCTLDSTLLKYQTLHIGNDSDGLGTQEVFSSVNFEV